MASLNILSYKLSETFNMKNAIESNVINLASNTSDSNNERNQLTKTFSKITVQSVLSENNGNSLNISNNNAIVRKIKDFGMFGSLSKRPLTESQTNTKSEKTEVVLPKKPKLSKETTTTPKTAKKLKNVANGSNPNTPGVKPAGTPGRKGLPLPQAVARRNARERNRVKQVNNGFAALRDRIPEEVAEAFEVHGNGRATSKKLSKVETLRMAVEYIRSLERLLGFDFPLNEHNILGSSACGSTSGSDSNLQFSPEAADHDNDFSLIKDEFDTLSPSLDEQYEDSLSNYDVDEYFTNSSGNNSDFLEPVAYKEAESPTMLPNITTLNGLQYIRIPGTNTYQLLTDDLFVDNSISSTFKPMEDEQINSIIGTKCSSTNAAETNLIAISTGQQQTAPASTLTCNGNAVSCTSMTNTTTTAANAAFMAQQQTTTLLQSPVPQAESSPNAKQQQQQVIEERGKCLQPAAISPAANELLLQTCAAATNNGIDPAYIAPMQSQQQQQLPAMNIIKQEFNDSHDYISTKSMHSPITNTTLIYQTANMKPQQTQNLLLNQTTLSISPPLENNSGTIISTFFPQLQPNNAATCFQRIIPIKKQYAGITLDANATPPLSNGLSDEGMIEALDWWDAHTPKSENGTTNI